MSYEKDHYGVEPMGIEESIALPDAVRRVRNCKIKMVDYAEYIRKMAEQIEFRAKRIPETNDEEHTKLCEEMCDIVKKANIATEAAAMFGMN